MSEIQKYGITTKWMDQLAPNLAHMSDSSGNGHRLKTISSSRPQGSFGWGCRRSKILDNLTNDWTAALLRMEGGIILLIATCILHEINSSVVVIVFIVFMYGQQFTTGSN